jgi:hypothetical protein
MTVTKRRIERINRIPSGKLLHNYGKSPFLMGKSTINVMAIFNSYFDITRGYFYIRKPPESVVWASRAFPGWGNFENSWTWFGGPETKVHLVAFDNDSPNTKPDAPCMKYVYHQNDSNVRKYTMHGAYGKGFWYFRIHGSHGSDPFSDGSCDVISPQPRPPVVV